MKISKVKSNNVFIEIPLAQAFSSLLTNQIPHLSLTLCFATEKGVIAEVPVTVFVFPTTK